MKGYTILETNIQGSISTNSNREKASTWKNDVARSLGSLDISLSDKQKISVDVKFWISSRRLRSRHNDLDNLVKPVLDSMKNIGIIQDDAEVFHLDVTKFSTEGEEEIKMIVKEWN
ncbi:MAG: RusA family crossover junction endodeoxyribonuclease [Nitrosopumilus sp.]|nr:RusA family crossover junction endodeoxyribonuclease [Nitrosopumilus sp.]